MQQMWWRYFSKQWSLISVLFLQWDSMFRQQVTLAIHMSYANMQVKTTTLLNLNWQRYQRFTTEPVFSKFSLSYYFGWNLCFFFSNMKPENKWYQLTLIYRLRTRLEIMPFIEIVGHNIFYIELARSSVTFYSKKQIDDLSYIHLSVRGV